MRTTISLADDVAAGVDKLRQERELGLSEAVNDLIRAGLSAERSVHAFRQESHDLGAGVEFSNIGDAIETLDGPTAR
jgi:metal-responsive CopG/Arc/MetJ family transcriptional regulator